MKTYESLLHMDMIPFLLSFAEMQPQAILDVVIGGIEPATRELMSPVRCAQTLHRSLGEGER